MVVNNVYEDSQYFMITLNRGSQSLFGPRSNHLQNMALTAQTFSKLRVFLKHGTTFAIVPKVI